MKSSSILAAFCHISIVQHLPNGVHSFVHTHRHGFTRSNVGSPTKSTRLLNNPKESNGVGDGDPSPFHVAVIGAGPSGLLLTHLLLKSKRLPNNTRVTIVEKRSDPRQKVKKGMIEERAYALGLGIRGRTAIRQVDEALWQAVKQRGFESERFQLHIGGFVIPLRSEKDGNGKNGVEPSVLTFQSDLCAAMTDELEKRHGKSKTSGGKLKIMFDAKVESCDLESMKIVVDETGDGTKTELGRFDLIVGCDGVNSLVRSAISSISPSFKATKERLPGEYKVVRLGNVPPKVDPTSVSLILPKKGSCTAFVEPTSNDGNCCILFAGRGNSPIISETRNVTAVVEALEDAFPQWKDFSSEVAEQLMAQTVPGSASSVVCNTYHFNGRAVLLGDAAHATGGVSGQGVNSALMDSAVLAECLEQDCENLGKALFNYSLRQVPEGKALYDLSFGPKPQGFQGILWAFRNARDTLFRGRFGIGQPPLQVRLTTEMTSFADIRRERDSFYEEPFPTESDFRKQLEALEITNSQLTDRILQSAS